MKLFAVKFSPPFSHFLYLRSNYPPQRPLLSYLQSMFFFYVRYKVSYGHKKQAKFKIKSTAILVFMFSDGRCESKNF
jgi:hypothetical protein